MNCARCGRALPSGALACQACGTASASVADLATQVGDAPGAIKDTSLPRPRAAAPGGSPASRRPPAVLAPGDSLGPRYEILAVLGEGGMGTVFKARDRELDRLVALKVIKSEMLAHPGVLERFKREILLASKVTHKNVLRIHDLGEVGDVRFISMNYVEGSDLKTLLKAEGPLALERALPIVRQIADALRAAHEAGIVHRDLKPQNILIDAQGNAFIADFGISRSLETGGTMTETGAILGTIDYMSPEQARGETPDHRGDLYSLGVILYEMFTGMLPFRADNPLSVMMKRVHQDAPTIRQSRVQAPPWISSIVARAMARDPEARYQSAADLLRDLDRHRASFAWPRLLRPRALLPAAAVVALGAAAAVYVARRPAAPAAVAGPKTSLAVLPFRNATGDAKYDWIQAGLPDLLRSDLLQTKALRVVGSERVRGVFDALKIAADDSRPETVRRVSGLVGVENALVGSLMKAGDRFRIEAILWRARAQDADGGPAIRVEGTGDDSLFKMVDDLTGRVRDALGVSGGWGEALRGASDLSTRSVEALRLYSEGQALSRAGNFTEAAKRLEASVATDAEFSVAHALLAETYDRLGFDDKAKAEADRAAQGTRRASAYEASRIGAVRARIGGDLEGAEKAYRALCDSAPNSAEAWFDLGSLQEEKGNLEAALASLQKAVALDPKHADAQYALGRVMVKRGKPAEALGVFNTVLALQGETGNEEGRAAALNGLGMAERSLGRYADAMRAYQESLTIRQRVGDRRGVRVSFTNLSVVERDQGHFTEAIQAAQQALAISREIGDNPGLADAYSNLGDIDSTASRPEEALQAYQESLKVVREIGDDALLARSYGNVGYTSSVLGRYVEAFFFLKEALAKRRAIGDREQIVQSLIDIGVVEQVQGRYEEALKYYLEGLGQAQQIGHKYATVILSANLSNIREDQGEYPAAIALLDDALKMAREMGDANLTATCLAYAGSVRFHLGDATASAAALDEAVKLARQINNTGILAEAQTTQGSLIAAQGQATRAVAVLKEALAVAEKSKDHRLILLARLRLAEAGASIPELGGVVKEAESSGLAPIVAPGYLAQARAHLAARRAAASLAAAQKAVAAATPLQERDLIFKAQQIAAQALAAQGDGSAAAPHLEGALAALEEMRRPLKDEPLKLFLARPDVALFGREALPLFEASGRSAEAGRLRAFLQP